MIELNGAAAQGEDIAPLALYNYGNFTTLLVDKRGVRGLSLHLDRLNRDAQALHGAGIDEEQVRTYIRHAVGDLKEPVVVRVTVFYRDFDLSKPAATKPGQDILITTRSAPSGILPPLALKPVPFQRSLPHIKSTDIGGSLYQRRLAQLEGFDDALFTTQAQEISEGPTWNIGFFRGGRVVLPDTPSLSGISMRLLQEALRDGDIPVQLVPVRLADLAEMEGAFVASATNGLRAVIAVGDQQLPETTALDMLRHVYASVPFEKF